MANWRIVVLGMMLTAMTTVTFYFITVYTPTFGKNVLKLSTTDSLLVTLFIAISNFFWLPIGGAISDRLGRKPVLMTITALALLTAYPGLSWLVNQPTFAKMLLFDLWLSMLFGMYNGAMVAALSEQVPPHVRTTCFSLAFSLAVALFGTFTPLVATWLIDRTGDPASPGFWLVGAASVSLIATMIVYRQRKPAPRVAAR
jgi:MHS family citrate/tricarballylate:H+ symporter-like MFS transporter